ncbi:HlyD family secretion protein [Sphingobacterium faecale]|uniref:Efflux RND transporter periplasmic adaptor subunit n=1 Tax=Sphingobacterium faecale TaxID=2803775 RepID=A0ABS1R3W1_9SPHI|nr:efflux RND transporter periplasmic adaptor subunit [Sphingobacterium faecale]MBL1409388.1 efflux RND transporter periplasmic adaptor subunit [Sphingobacterium faecale]
MNSIINKTAFLGILCTLWCYSCSSGGETEVDRGRKEILDEISDVRAIGKLTPSTADVIISSSVVGRVKEIFVKDGDSVGIGQVIAQLESEDAYLDLQRAQLEMSRLKVDIKTTEEEIAKATTILEERSQKYQTSRRLVELNAETKEVLEGDRSSWRQQKATLRGLQSQLEAQRLVLEEQNVNIKKVGKLYANLHIEAVGDGIINDLNVRLGQYIEPGQELGRIITTSNPIVEAEVDELFANEVKVGQKVSVYAVTSGDKSIRGELVYVSPILSNKSIFYDTANEAQDRRVRRVKIKLEEESGFVINTKVDCEIKIK